MASSACIPPMPRAAQTMSAALDVRLVGRQVPCRHRYVDRLDHDAALPVQDAERVSELEDVAEGLEVAVATTALEVADVRARR